MAEPATICTIHGKQDGPSCAECDKEAPDAVSGRNPLPTAGDVAAAKELLKRAGVTVA